MESLCPKRMSRRPLSSRAKMAVIAVAASFGHVLGVLLALAGLEWYLVRAARDAPEERAARKEAARLRAAIRRHDSVEHFVQKSKLERELIAAEKALETHRSATAARVGIARRQGGQARVGACVCLALWCHGAALARVRPASAVWPLGWFLAFPSLPPGSVGVMPLLLLFHQAASRFGSL